MLLKFLILPSQQQHELSLSGSCTTLSVTKWQGKPQLRVSATPTLCNHNMHNPISIRAQPSNVQRSHTLQLHLPSH
jgi:hypothetical protein